jgi:hypothetical protein
MIKHIKLNINNLSLILITLILWVSPLVLYSQDPVNKDTIEILEDEDEIIINNKLFTKKNHWLSIGTGYGFYAEKQNMQSSFGADIHFLIKEHYFTLGYLYTGQNFISSSYALQLNDIHVGYGWRKENRLHNHYFFTGPSLALGYAYSHTDSLGRPWDVGFINPGLYAEYQYSFKINYDMGLGLAAYTSLSFGYQTVGLKAILYLSTAYIGRTD